MFVSSIEYFNKQPLESKYLCVSSYGEKLMEIVCKTNKKTLFYVRQMFVEVVYELDSEEPDQVYELSFKELTPYIKAIQLPKKI